MTSKQDELLNLFNKQEKLHRKIDQLKRDLDASLSLREFVVKHNLDDNIKQLLTENPNISYKIAYGCLVLNFKSFDMSECALEFDTNGVPEQLTISGYSFAIDCDTDQLERLIEFVRSYSHDIVKYNKATTSWEWYKNTYSVANSIIPQ